MVDASSEWMWCLMPGEWPDLPPQEASELGNVVELVQTISLLFQLVTKNESCRRLEECWRLETHCENGLQQLVDSRRAWNARMD